jgi:MoaA/NifB/PqqE/SkfB family radical SAM enzyme
MIDGIKFNLAGTVYRPKPLFSNARITHRCNAHCLHCSYWKENTADKELSPEEIGEIYKDPLFSSLEKITLTGGEPTERDDLVDIADTVLQSCRRVKQITLCTNCLDPDRVTRSVKDLLSVTKKRKVSRLNVSTSLDGVGQLHETIRGMPRAFEKFSETISSLQEIQKRDYFFLGATCVVQPLNFLYLEDVAIFGKKNKFIVRFAPVYTSYILTDDNFLWDQLQFSQSQLEELKEIIKDILWPYLGTHDKVFWGDYFKIIKGAERRLPCYLLNHFVSLDIDRILRGCGFDNNLIFGNIKEDSPHTIWFSDKTKRLRNQLKNRCCPHCTIHCDIGTSLAKEFFSYAWYLCQEQWRVAIGKGEDW